MLHNRVWIPAIVLGVSSTLSTAAIAADEWHFGIGTGFSSFSLDGDLGFATPAGGLIRDIDLDNSDTSDMLESAFGFAAVATNKEWDFLFTYGTSTLEDSNSDINAEWDRTTVEAAVVYNFSRTGSTRWGALGGVRETNHEWDIESRHNAFSDVNPDDEWTDLILGVTHMMIFNKEWSWRNRFDVGFGDTESAYNFTTGVYWRPIDHWTFNVNAKYLSTEFGDKGDRNKSDFYFYEVDETAFGVGFMYDW